MIFACTSEGEKNTENAIETITSGDVDIEINEDKETGKMTIEGEDGKSVTIEASGKEVPENFPDDIFLVKGDIESAGSMASGEMEIITVVIFPQSGFDDVIQKIKKEMKSKGWKSAMNMNMGDQAILNYTKEKNNVAITISKDEDGKVEVGYMATIEK